MGLEWFFIACFVAVYFASRRSFARGAESAGHMYREAKARLTRDAVAAGHGAGTMRTAARSGKAVAATISGTRLHLAAWRKGWLEGWRRGWKGTQARRDGTTDYQQRTTDPGEEPLAGPGTVLDEPTDATVTVTCTYPVGPTTDSRRCGRSYQAWRVPTGHYEPRDCGQHAAPTPPPATGTRGPDGQDTPAGRRAMDLDRCPWNYGERVCGKPRDPNPTPADSPFCREHNNELAARTTARCPWPTATGPCGGEVPPMDSAKGSNYNTYCPRHARRAEDDSAAHAPNAAAGPATPPRSGRPASGPPAPTGDGTEPSKPEQKGNPMAPTANVEIRTVRQLVDYLKEVKDAALAELDDAKADAQRATTSLDDAKAALERARQRSTAMEQAQAHLASMKLDAASLGEIAAVHADCAAEVTNAQKRFTAAEVQHAAATQRIKDCEVRAAHATTAATNIWKRHGGMQTATEDASVNAADGGAYNPV